MAAFSTDNEFNWSICSTDEGDLFVELLDFVIPDNYSIENDWSTEISYCPCMVCESKFLHWYPCNREMR